VHSDSQATIACKRKPKITRKPAINGRNGLLYVRLSALAIPGGIVRISWSIITQRASKFWKGVLPGCKADIHV